MEATLRLRRSRVVSNNRVGKETNSRTSRIRIAEIKIATETPMLRTKKRSSNGVGIGRTISANSARTITGVTSCGSEVRRGAKRSMVVLR